MSQDAEHSELTVLPVELIDPNPDNPRIVFRPGELEKLQESIAQHGVQVPISVYRKGRRYVLIDGERRWRCCLKLNKKHIPALVQNQPTPLTNLLLMFNIHMVREQWDLLTIALKLPLLIEMLGQELGRSVNERDVAEKTGLSRSEVRRSKLLMELPEAYRGQILDELSKPKKEQKLTEDFFIEMERALKTVERAMPGTIKNKNKARDMLIRKYSEGVVGNITDFRNLSRIARAEYVAADKEAAEDALQKVLNVPDYSIKQAFEDSVSEAYTERDLLTSVDSLIEQLEDLKPNQVDKKLRLKLELLIEQVNTTLGRAK